MCVGKSMRAVCLSRLVHPGGEEASEVAATVGRRGVGAGPRGHACGRRLSLVTVTPGERWPNPKVVPGPSLANPKVAPVAATCPNCAQSVASLGNAESLDSAPFGL